MSAPDIRAAAYASAAIDREIESASRNVDRLCHVPDEGFAPTVAVRSFDYPNAQSAQTGRLWLNQNGLISLTAATSAGVNILASTFMEPVNSGPPYRSIEINRATSAVLASGAGTGQRSIVLSGLWADCPNTEETPGALASSPNASVTSWTVNFRAGVGDILRVDSERVRVIEKAWVASGQTGSLAAAMNAQTLAVADGTVFAAGEELLIDAERLLVRDVSGNNLIVQRAWSGSTLAVHSTASIAWPRVLVVARGALGTTATSHTTSTAVQRFIPPGPIEQLTRAWAIDGFFQSGAGWARTVGAADNERQATGQGIKVLAELVYGNYARKTRFRSV